MRNKNKKYYNQWIYRCKSVKERDRRKVNRTIIIMFIVYFCAINIGLAIKNYKHLLNEISAPFATHIAYANELNSNNNADGGVDIRQQIIQILEKRNKDKNFQDKFLKIVECESKFDIEAAKINRHKNGSISLDRGILQWNSFYHKEIKNSCAYNLECAVNAAIDYLEKTNRWQEWLCS